MRKRQLARNHSECDIRSGCNRFFQYPVQLVPCNSGEAAAYHSNHSTTPLRPGIASPLIRWFPLYPRFTHIKRPRHPRDEIPQFPLLFLQHIFQPLSPTMSETQPVRMPLQGELYIGIEVLEEIIDLTEETQSCVNCHRDTTEARCDFVFQQCGHVSHSTLYNTGRRSSPNRVQGAMLQMCARRDQIPPLPEAS